MVVAGEECCHAVPGAGVHDAGIVGRHHAGGGLALCGPLRHPHHHGQAGDVGQGLVGQAGRAHPCRDQHGEIGVRHVSPAVPGRWGGPARRRSGAGLRARAGWECRRAPGRPGAPGARSVPGVHGRSSAAPW